MGAVLWKTGRAVIHVQYQSADAKKIF